MDATWNKIGMWVLEIANENLAADVWHDLVQMLVMSNVHKARYCRCNLSRLQGTMARKWTIPKSKSVCMHVYLTCSTVHLTRGSTTDIPGYIKICWVCHNELVSQ